MADRGALMLAMLLLLGNTGCGAGTDFGFDGAEVPEGDAIAPGTLRVDLQPSGEDLTLLPQSFPLAPGTYGDGLVNTHTVEAGASISGILTATTMRGWGSAPSAEGPLDAVIRAERTGLVQGGAGQTDETGFVSFLVPSNQPYSVQIAPRDATASPMVLLANEIVDPASGLDLTRVIDAGAPVYGRVVDSEGVALAGVPLHMLRTDLDVRSGTFTTDTNGWFVARAQPGYSYALETEGFSDPQDGAIPTLSLPFVVEDANGAEVEVNVGDRTTVPFTADVVDADGKAVSQPHVRATSESLTTGSLVVEDSGTGSGVIQLNLLPGTWTIEVWPDGAGETSTPWSASGLVIGEGTPRRTIELGSARKLKGTITTATGDAAAGVSVTVEQLGFGGSTYSTVTGDDGSYSLSVPRSPSLLLAFPPAAESGAYTHQYLDLAGDDADASGDLELVEGTTLQGLAVTADGTPVPNAVVNVYDYARELLLARAITGSDGSYTVRVDVPAAEEITDTGVLDTGR